MENVDKVIEVLCEKIYGNHIFLNVDELCVLTKSLADLVVAKSKVKQSEVSIDTIAYRIQGHLWKQLEESKSDRTRVKEGVSKKRDKPSVEVGIKVDTKELSEAIVDIDKFSRRIQEVLQEELDKAGSSINKGVLERANQLVIDERKTGALNLVDLENRINNDALKAIADEALKIYSITKDERVALSALDLILNAVQL